MSSVVSDVGGLFGIGGGGGSSAPKYKAPAPAPEPLGKDNNNSSAASLEHRRSLLSTGAFDSGATRSGNEADVLGVTVPETKKKEAVRTLLG